MKTICVSIQIDNHIKTSSLNSYRTGALPDARPTVSKHANLEIQEEFSAIYDLKKTTQINVLKTALFALAICNGNRKTVEHKCTATFALHL